MSEKVSDFHIDSTYTFRVVGKNISNKQIQGVKNSFIAADDIEYGNQNRIPLWLFGFMY
ncbi:MAG: AAA family ATPase [Mongoliibacter sp.]|nr:MAG: AAA family ATPase [Mongoliibacter sp.]